MLTGPDPTPAPSEPAENVRDDLERRLAAWRPIVEAALAQERASTVATPIGVIRANLGPSEALREYRARCALTNAVARALPPEHRPDANEPDEPDMTPLARPSPAWIVAIDPDTPLVAPAKPFIPPSMLEPDDDAPEPPA